MIVKYELKTQTEYDIAKEISNWMNRGKIIWN